MSHEQFADCIEACNACAAACEHCATECLKEKDVKMMVRCIQLDWDCAPICRVAAGVMARGSDLAPSFCTLCAEVCRACADECRKHDADHCQECADACEACADECQKMSVAA